MNQKGGVDMPSMWNEKDRMDASHMLGRDGFVEYFSDIKDTLCMAFVTDSFVEYEHFTCGLSRVVSRLMVGFILV